MSFQSSPARGGGCNRPRYWRSTPVRSCFNPHPPVGAGATERRAEVFADQLDVSILTRPWGRVQHRPVPLAPHLSRSFNPHPPVGAGAAPAHRGTDTPRARFNPHPPVGAGATVMYATVVCSGYRFNPHPPVGAGATRSEVAPLSPVARVSILTRPWGRVQPPKPSRAR